MQHNKEDTLSEEQVEFLFEVAEELYGLDSVAVTVIDSMSPDIYEKFKKSRSNEAIELVIEAIEKESQ